jgi:hypothetical protein
MLVGTTLLLVALTCSSWAAFFRGSKPFPEIKRPEDKFRAYQSLYCYLM